MVAVSKSFISAFLLAPHLVSGVKSALDPDLQRIYDERKARLEAVRRERAEVCSQRKNAQYMKKNAERLGQRADMERKFRTPSLEDVELAELGEDLQRMESASLDEEINVIVRTGSDHFEVVASSEDNVYEAIAKVAPRLVIESVEFGGEEVSQEDIFSDLGIGDGAKISAVTRPRATFEEFVKEVVALNHHLTEDDLMVIPIKDELVPVQVDPKNPSRVLGHVKWVGKRIVALPECISDIRIDGSLVLDWNKLTSLPESFGDIMVGGCCVSLNNNQLTRLPESFGNLKVRTAIYLEHNNLTTFPESFTRNFKERRHGTWTPLLN